jgi:hypothetical protein
MCVYTLFKNPIQENTLGIVRFLHANGIILMPQMCIERNHPEWVVDLPCIETKNGDRYIGFDECVRFYEEQSKITNIVACAKEFKTINQPYIIRDIVTKRTK